MNISEKLRFIKEQMQREELAVKKHIYVVNSEFTIRKKTTIVPVPENPKYSYIAERNYKLNMEKAYQQGGKITEILSSLQYKGSSCVIVGAGPSLKNFNFESLRDRYVIGVNRTFENYDGCDILFSMDTRYYQWLKNGVPDNHLTKDIIEKWRNVKSKKIFLAPLSPYKFESDIYLIRRLPVGDVSFSLERGIYCADNSMFGGMMLAVALGFNLIYLLGLDLNKEDPRSHNHSGYPFPFSNIKYDRMIKSFYDMAPKLDKAGVEVFNLNPYSGVRAFPFITKKGFNLWV